MKQKAVLWKRLNEDHDNPVWDPPIEIRCRWEFAIGASEQVVERMQHIAEVMRFQSSIYVDRDVRVGDYILLAPLAYATKLDPRDEASWEITIQEKFPNFRNTRNLRKCHAFPSHLAVRDLHGKGVEEITYYRLTKETHEEGGTITQDRTKIPIAVAIGSRPTEEEMVLGRGQGDGRMQTTERVWAVAKHLLKEEPGLEDHFIDSHGERWDVVHWDDGILRTWWRLYTKRGA